MTAGDGQQALDLVGQWHPDLVLVDLMMPGVDGVEVTRRLRADAMTTALPVIMLTAKGQTVDKVMGLTAGADDYIVKPFDTMELVARVRGTLRRNQEFREVSPLTGLPGNNRILREIDDRIRMGDRFAVCYCDIDKFKAVNDAYGFARGDEFIVTLARKLVMAVGEIGPPPAFLGHIGGDDFVVICSPDQVLELTDRAVTEFEAAADALYDARRPRSRLRQREEPPGRRPRCRPGHGVGRCRPVQSARLHGSTRGDRRRERDEDGGQEPTWLVRGRGPSHRTLAVPATTAVAAWLRHPVSARQRLSWQVSAM